MWYDEGVVLGLRLATDRGRGVMIGGTVSSDSSGKEALRASAAPCPGDAAHEGRYRLAAIGGTADRWACGAGEG